MGDKLKFDDYYDRNYEPTDSEDDYSEEEKELLQKVRDRNKERDKNAHHEVLAFEDSDDDDDMDDPEEEQEDENDNGDDDIDQLMSDSDIEGAGSDDDNIPDRKAWGSRARHFYGTDFVDPDYSSYTDKEREQALAEEEEALAIQKRLAAGMKEENFMLKVPGMDKVDVDEYDMLKPGTETEKGVGVIEFTTNLNGLSKTERLQYLQKDSPEFLGLVEDLLLSLKECGSVLKPVLNYAKANELLHIPALKFAKVMYNLMTSYCANINFYLMLKAKRISIRNHPILNRLLHFKDMLEELSEKYENMIKPQLEKLLNRIGEGKRVEIIADEQPTRKKSLKRVKFSEASVCKISGDENRSQQTESDDASQDEGSEAHSDGEDERRNITYQIAKNKGLTPHRRKELRNPRVKHRNKFRKALIRRKGAVRTVRKEVKRYGGEISGIKATVSKSIKFK